MLGMEPAADIDDPAFSDEECLNIIDNLVENFAQAKTSAVRAPIVPSGTTPHQ